MKNRLRKVLSAVLQPALAIFIALCVGALAMLFTDENPIHVYGVMFKGAFGNLYYLLTTLNRATPIIICGLGAAIAWSSQYMGIGGEGQMIFGGFTAAIIALYGPGPIWVRFVCAVLGALLVGGLVSMLSAWLLDKFKMSLAISTLMLNYTARFLTMHWVTNSFLDRADSNKLVQTLMVDEAMRLPKIVEGYTLHIGFVLAVLLVIGMWFLMNRTKFGYEAKMSGYNLNFCNYGGISSKKTMYLVLGLSGVICALAGVGEVFGVQYRYLHDAYVSGSFAWVGLNAALISNYDPIGIFFTSIILAGIQTGGGAIARSTHVPLEISSIIQGCITLFISAKIIIKWRRQTKAAKANPTPPPALDEGGENVEGGVPNAG